MRKNLFSFFIKAACLYLLTTGVLAQISGNDKNPKESRQTNAASAIQAVDSKTSKECDFSEYDTLKVIPKNIYLLLKEQPAYPKTAKRKKINGDVVVKVLLNREGQAEQMCVVSGHKLLVPPTLAVIRKWRYPKESIQKDLNFGNHKYLEFVVTYTFK